MKPGDILDYFDENGPATLEVVESLGLDHFNVGSDGKYPACRYCFGRDKAICQDLPKCTHIIFLHPKDREAYVRDRVAFKLTGEEHETQNL